MAREHINMTNCTSRQSKNIQKSFKANKALLELQANVNTIHKNLVETSHQPQILPAWLLHQRKAEDFL